MDTILYVLVILKFKNKLATSTSYFFKNYMNAWESFVPED